MSKERINAVARRLMENNRLRPAPSGTELKKQPAPMIPATNRQYLKPNPTTQSQNSLAQLSFKDVNPSDFNPSGVPSSPVQDPVQDPVMDMDEAQLYDHLLRQMSSGIRDTSADARRIRNEMDLAAGQGQADLNARMAGMGFGTSGALGTMTSDLRRAAAEEAAGQIADLNQQARNEYFDRIRNSLGTLTADRSLDMEETRMNTLQNLIESMFGGDEDLAAKAKASGKSTYDFLADQTKAQKEYKRLVAKAKAGDPIAKLMLQYMNYVNFKSGNNWENV